MPKKKEPKMTPQKEVVALKSVIIFLTSALEFHAIIKEEQKDWLLETIKDVGKFSYSKKQYYEDMGEEAPVEKPF